MTRPLTILVDMDAIVVNLLGPWLDAFNQKELAGAKRLVIEDVKLFNVEHFVQKHHVSSLFGIFEHYDFWEKLPPIEGAIPALQELQKAGHEIILASTPANAASAAAKVNWMKGNLGFLPKQNLVLLHQKDLLDGDVLIDDKPSTLELFKKTRPETMLATIRWPYNLDVRVEVAGRDWKDTRKAWKEIVEGIGRWSDLSVKEFEDKLAAGRQRRTT